MDKDYFLSTLIKDKEYLIYSSEPFKLTEIDIINLIKICLVEGRSKYIGKRLLSVYRDSTIDREDITNERLIKIGVEKNGKPEISKKPKTK